MSIHPGAWLVWAGLGGLVALATTNPFYLLPLFASAYIVHTAHGQPARAGGSFKLFALFGVATIVTRTGLAFVIESATASNLAAAALEGLRLAVLLAVYGAFNSVSDPYRFLKLAPRRFHEASLAAALALSIAPRTIAAVGRVREAQRLRGIQVSRRRAIPALAVPVLATGMEEAMTLAESMEARGHGRGPRSLYRPERWGSRSWATVAFALLGATIVLVNAAGGAGHLSVSTFPLHWPDASLWVLAGVLAFAAPAFIPRGDAR